MRQPGTTGGEPDRVVRRRRVPAPAQKATAKRKGAGSTAGRAPRAPAPRSTGDGAGAATPPGATGPRVRLGVLWFLLALAAATSGRWWTAGLWAPIAFVAGYQVVAVWGRHRAPAKGDRPAALSPTCFAGAVLAGAGAAGVTVAAAYSTGLTGVILTASALTGGVALLTGRSHPPVAPVVVGVLLPAVAAISVVLAVRIDLWAGIFLILAVSLYDAGSYLFGAEASSRWHGPIAGAVGALAVTFTMSTVQVPFDRIDGWIAGAAVTVGCVAGQLLVATLLPASASRAGAVHRLDAYLLSGPLLVLCAWFLGT